MEAAAALLPLSPATRGHGHGHGHALVLFHFSLFLLFRQTLVECPRQTTCWARVGHGAGQGMRPGTCCGRATLVGGLPRASRAARAVGRLGGGLQPRAWTPTLGPEPRGGAGPVWGVWRPEAACAQDGAARGAGGAGVRRSWRHSGASGRRCSRLGAGEGEGAGPQREGGAGGKRGWCVW